MDGESDAVLHADFAQQLCDVRFDGALDRSPVRRDLAIGAARDQQPQHFALAFADFVVRLRLHSAAEAVARSMKVASTRRGTHTEPAWTSRMARLNSAGDASSESSL